MFYISWCSLSFILPNSCFKTLTTCELQYSRPINFCKHAFHMLTTTICRECCRNFLNLSFAFWDIAVLFSRAIFSKPGNIKQLSTNEYLLSIDSILFEMRFSSSPLVVMRYQKSCKLKSTRTMYFAHFERCVLYIRIELNVSTVVFFKMCWSSNLGKIFEWHEFSNGINAIHILDLLLSMKSTSIWRRSTKLGDL